MKLNRILIYLLSATLFLLIYAPLYEWWCTTGVGNLLGGVATSDFNDVVVLVLAVVGVVLAALMPSQLSDQGNQWVRIIAGCLCYVIVVMSVAFNDRFVHFSAVPWFRYTDSLLCALLTFCFVSSIRTCKNRKNETVRHRGSRCIYVDDTDEIDFLGRSDLVDHIYEHISEMGINPNGAVGVAVTGGWGAGKSWLLSQVQRNLAAGGEICVDFKPWLYGENDMARSFYLTLEATLRENGMRMEELKKAVSEIDNDSLVGVGKAFMSLLGALSDNGGRERAVQRIKNKLRASGRRIFVFIDDCDRLAHRELMQVLSLIRNAGDFPGLTYIMAFDRQVAEELIGSEKGMNYIGKMFNLTVDLPPVSDDVIADYLYRSASEIIEMDYDMENPYKRINITRYLPTVRDAKKYLNLLSTDYHRHQGRFKKYHYCEADFCLLELLKYKYSDLYYGLEADHKRYLKTENSGWNSPSLIPDESVITDMGQYQLLSSIFRTLNDSRDPYSLIGVANSEYFPMYFEKELQVKYPDRYDIHNALHCGTLPSKVKEWFENGLRGVVGYVSSVHSSMTRKDVFLCMSECIWQLCERRQPGTELGTLTYGFGKDGLKHGFKHIMNIIRQTPQIGLMTFQHLISDGDPDVETHQDGVLEIIEEHGHVWEMMGIWLDQLRSVNDSDYPYSEVRYYVMRLWDRLMKDYRQDESMTMNIIDVLGECTLEDTFELMVLPLICADPRRWLGATVTIVKDDDKEYFLLKSRAVHALFGSLDRAFDELDMIRNMTSKENLGYLDAYTRMVRYLAEISIDKDEFTIHANYGDISIIEAIESNPLHESVILGMNSYMPIGHAIAQIKEMPFWKGECLRIHRADPGYYFGTEI